MRSSQATTLNEPSPRGFVPGLAEQYGHWLAVTGISELIGNPLRRLSACAVLRGAARGRAVVKVRQPSQRRADEEIKTVVAGHTTVRPASRRPNEGVVPAEMCPPQVFIHANRTAGADDAADPSGRTDRAILLGLTYLAYNGRCGWLEPCSHSRSPFRRVIHASVIRLRVVVSVVLRCCLPSCFVRAAVSSREASLSEIIRASYRISIITRVAV